MLNIVDVVGEKTALDLLKAYRQGGLTLAERDLFLFFRLMRGRKEAVFRVRSCGFVSRICHLLAGWPLNLREP